jgi:hypothetical protein
MLQTILPNPYISQISQTKPVFNTPKLGNDNFEAGVTGGNAGNQGRFVAGIML